MPRGRLIVAALSMLCFVPLAAPRAHGQDSPAAGQSGDRLRVFLDCPRCDTDYLRTEIRFVDYVRDRTDADVHILATTLQTGAGGTEYTFQFNGQRQFQGVTEELRHVSGPTDSQDRVREGVARAIRAGLVRYAARTPLLSRMQITISEAPAGAAPAAVVRDRWNRWVFRTSLTGYTSGESSYDESSWSVSASANRTTAEWKHVLSMSNRSSESEFDVGEGRTVVNTRTDRSASMQSVKSLSSHWSIGSRANANQSSFLNRDLALRVAPAIEFNVFPYSESTRRQLTFQYSPGANRIRYNESTIFGKMEETLWDQALTASYNMTQRWGTVRVSSEAFHYFHDTSKYHVTSFGNLDLRLIKGVSLTFFGQADRIRDQLHLAAGNLTPEQILLRQRQISTSFRYYGQVGLSYSFGSIYSPVVNPRMGGGGGGGVIFF